LAQTRDDLAQEFEALAGNIGRLTRQPGDVAARARETRDDAGADRIARGRASSLGRSRPWRTAPTSARSSTDRHQPDRNRAYRRAPSSPALRSPQITSSPCLIQARPSAAPTDPAPMIAIRMNTSWCRARTNERFLAPHQPKFEVLRRVAKCHKQTFELRSELANHREPASAAELDARPAYLWPTIVSPRCTGGVVRRYGYSPYVPLAGPTRKTCQLSICLMKSPQIGAIRSPWKSET